MTNPERAFAFMVRRVPLLLLDSETIDAIVAYSIEHASAEVERRRAAEAERDQLRRELDNLRIFFDRLSPYWEPLSDTLAKEPLATYGENAIKAAITVIHGLRAERDRLRQEIADRDESEAEIDKVRDAAVALADAISNYRNFIDVDTKDLDGPPAVEIAQRQVDLQRLLGSALGAYRAAKAEAAR